jgi:hypothetical protein
MGSFCYDVTEIGDLLQMRCEGEVGVGFKAGLRLWLVLCVRYCAWYSGTAVSALKGKHVRRQDYLKSGKERFND